MKALSRSFRLRFTLLIVAVVVISLLAAMVYVSMQVAQLLSDDAREELAFRAASLADSVSGWDRSTVLALHNLSANPDIESMDPARQKPILTQMAGIYQQMYLISTTDLEGMNIARSDSADLTDYSDRPWFKGAATGNNITRQTLIGRTSGEPAVCYSTPIRNDMAQIQGVAMACSDLDVLPEQVGAVKLGQTGVAFVVDDRGQVIAHPDATYATELKDLSTYPPVAALFSGVENLPFEPFEDENDIRWLANGKLLDNGYAVVVQQQESEVLTGVRQFWQWAIVAMAIVAVAVGVLTWLVTRRLLRPISNLTEAATAFANGDLSQLVTMKREDEFGILARAFNTMATQIRTMISELGSRIAARTERLEIVANLSEKLSAILDLDELLNEVVNQIQERFGYYHAHIYLLDESTGKLVVAAGTGEAGAEMKASGHNIPMNAPASLVARAARSGKIVTVDNVREAPDWLPNRLLPDTYSEMAVPIVLTGTVVGVLDVQQNKIAGLDEGDAGLLRSLANQVAVAIRNARLFAETEAALAEAREVQERYVKQSWQVAEKTSGNRYVYINPGVEPLDETKLQTLERTKERALTENSPAVVVQEDDKRGEKSLTVPINLRDKTIGALQLHGKGNRHWTEDDMALIEAITDQLSQTAETLRLFEEAQDRAGREQTIREITDKLRAAPNLDALLETAARELGLRLGARHTVLEMGIETATNGTDKHEEAVDTDQVETDQQE